MTTVKDWLRDVWAPRARELVAKARKAKPKGMTVKEWSALAQFVDRDAEGLGEPPAIAGDRGDLAALSTPGGETPSDDWAADPELIDRMKGVWPFNQKRKP